MLRDDYPGTTAYSLVALKEGVVDVTLTGPLGKYDIKRIYVLPVDEFSGGGGPDGPKPPDFDDPDPWRFDLGTWVGGFLVDGLLKPFLRPSRDVFIVYRIMENRNESCVDDTAQQIDRESSQ